MTYATREHQIKAYEYHTTQEDLVPQEIARFICEIKYSNEYDLEDLGHILVTGTDTVIGFIGDDRVDLVDIRNKTLHQHHITLIALLSKSLN